MTLMMLRKSNWIRYFANNKGCPVKLPVFDDFLTSREKIAVVGLGYVGLPLAVYFADHYQVVGYDIDAGRIKDLGHRIDRTGEVAAQQLEAAKITFTQNPKALSACRLIIVAVPTPIDAYRNPDLRPLTGASETVGQYMRQGTVVAYESTVYPGATEEVCLPLLEKISGLKHGDDFWLGYSPERMNPGDKQHTVAHIPKVVAGATLKVTDLLAAVYGQVVKAGIHPVSSIKVAEAAKVIENTQRDLNIALMNELAMIFDRMQIDTREVLTAAGTKWNFMPFQPGLVGGHCIGVDPYYLTFKAESVGYHPEMILAGRRINDGMGKFIAERTVKMLLAADRKVRGARVAVLGLTFKENVPDLRNTRVVDILDELAEYGITVLVHDPLAVSEEALDQYGVQLLPQDRLSNVDAVIVAVGHDLYRKWGLDGIAQRCNGKLPIIVDVKGILDVDATTARKIHYWRL